MSTPMACSASCSGCLKCSAHESWQPVGVGHRRQRPADVLAPRRVDAGGHLAEPVVVVPHVQVPGVEPAAPELLGDEVHGEELAQVAEVHPAGRAGARRDRDDLGALAGVPDRVVGGAGHPVVRLAGRSLGAPCRHGRQTLPGHDERVRRGLDAARCGAARVRRSRRRRCTRTPRRTPTPSSRAGRSTSSRSGCRPMHQLARRTRTGPAARSPARPSRRPCRRPGRRRA